MKIALTDMGVQRLKPGTYFDTRTPAFGIRVGKNRRTWIVTKGQHPRRTVTLGHYPAISLQDARRKAMAAFVAPEQQKATIAYPEAKDLFLAQERWRPGTKRVLTSNLRHFPWKGQLAKISHEQVIEALDAVEGKSARAHALKDIRTFFNWCVPRYLASSPAAGIQMEKQRSRNRILSDSELKAVWSATGEMGAFGAIARLLILSGQRCGEIGRLHSSFIEQDRIHLPPSITKNGREHWVPVTEYSRTLLPETNGYLFPNSLGNPFTAFAFNHKRLLKMSGTAGWTLHDLRRTFATGLAALGTPIHVTEKILNHVSGSLSGVAGIYNRFDYWGEQVAAMTAWEERVLSIVRQ